MSVATLVAPHPIVGSAAEMRGALAGLADTQPVFMTVAEKETALVELGRIEAQVAELKARILAASDDVADAHGARDVAAWLAHVTQADPMATRAELRLAKALERRTGVADGMRTGGVSRAQAQVIVAAVEELPADLGPALACEAAEWPVRHRSSPSYSAETQRSSTPGGPSGCSPGPSGGRYGYATGGAEPRAARFPPPGPRPTTSTPGRPAGPPISPTISLCSHHHHRIHDRAHDHRMLPSGHPLPPTHIGHKPEDVRCSGRSARPWSSRRVPARRPRPAGPRDRSGRRPRRGRRCRWRPPSGPARTRPGR